MAGSKMLFGGNRNRSSCNVFSCSAARPTSARVARSPTNIHPRRIGSPLESEVELQPELDDACVCRAEDLTEAARVPRDVGRSEVGVIEGVEQLGAELDGARSRDRKVLRQREVEVRDAGTTNDADAGVTERLR